MWGGGAALRNRSPRSRRDGVSPRRGGARSATSPSRSGLQLPPPNAGAVAVAVAVAAPIGRTPTEKMAGRRTFRFC